MFTYLHVCALKYPVFHNGNGREWEWIYGNDMEMGIKMSKSNVLGIGLRMGMKSWE